MIGYLKYILKLQERIAPFAEKLSVRNPRWIVTPDGDQGDDWCSDCGYYKMRNLRRHDKKRRNDYFLDGGWAQESDGFRHCAGCGVNLEIILHTSGAEEEIRHFQECGFSTAVDQDAYEINELLGVIDFSGMDETPERKRLRKDIVQLARDFLKQVHARAKGACA